MHLEKYPALVLNADFRPLSLSPLSHIGWQDAVKAVYEDTHSIVAVYEDAVIRSPSVEMHLPSVLMLKRYVDRTGHHAPFTRWNVFLSTGFRCAFCDKRFRTEDLTFEHLLPRARGGRSSWDNVVPACVPCNTRKGCRTPEEAGMPLIHKPYRPSKEQIDTLARTHMSSDPYFTARHRSWADALYWTVQLDK